MQGSYGALREGEKGKATSKFFFTDGLPWSIGSQQGTYRDRMSGGKVWDLDLLVHEVNFRTGKRKVDEGL